MFRKRYLSTFAVICFCALVNQAQPTTALLMIESGGSVQFHINSLTKYNDGIALEDWTRIAVSFEDTENAASTWNLQFRAMSAVIQGDYVNDLPLDYIFVEVRDAGGNTLLGEGGNGIISMPLSLDSGWQTLITGAPQGGFQDNKLYISYRLGTEAKLLGRNPDYYIVDIEFQLTAN